VRVDTRTSNHSKVTRFLAGPEIDPRETPIGRPVSDWPLAIWQPCTAHEIGAAKRRGLAFETGPGDRGPDFAPNYGAISASLLGIDDQDVDSWHRL
jgi:hypothetical protein